MFRLKQNRFLCCECNVEKFIERQNLWVSAFDICKLHLCNQTVIASALQHRSVMPKNWNIISAQPEITFKAIRTYSLIDCQRNLVRVRQIRITTSEGGDMTMNAPTAEPGRWERVDPDSYRNGGPGIACSVKP